MQTITFDQALDIVQALPQEQQLSLIEIVKRQVIEARRATLLIEHQEGKAEFLRGELKRMTIEELKKDLLE